MRVDCSSMEELFPWVYQIPLISLLIQHAYFYDKVKKLFFTIIFSICCVAIVLFYFFFHIIWNFMAQSTLLKSCQTSQLSTHTFSEQVWSTM